MSPFFVHTFKEFVIDELEQMLHEWELYSLIGKILSRMINSLHP
jgi:hypothetical protein